MWLFIYKRIKMNIRQKLYDHLFGDVNLSISTTNLYFQFLQKMKLDATILDIGVGTGIYFDDPRCAEIIKQKNIKIIGIDINKEDVEVATNRILANKLSHHISANHVDLFEYNVNLNDFDVILFSESYPVIPKDLMKKMLTHIISNRFSNELIFINNIEDNPTWLQKTFKSLLKYVLFGVEFGRLISTNDMIEMFTSVGIESDIAFKLLASATPNYVLFKDKLKLPGLNFEMKQYMISVKCKNFT